MIVAVEGPDWAGKTTMWTWLRQAIPGVLGYPVVAVRHPSVNATTFQSMAIADLEVCLMHIVRAMYDPRQVYLFDRFYTITGPIYGTLMQRPCQLLSDPLWLRDVRILYLSMPIAVLEERSMHRPDRHISRDMIPALVAAYDSFMTAYPNPAAVMTVTPETSEAAILERLEGWLSANVWPILSCEECP